MNSIAYVSVCMADTMSPAAYLMEWLGVDANQDPESIQGVGKVSKVYSGGE